MFKYSDDNKRYHTLAYYNRHKYGKKVFKAVIDAGFSCPNKDGKAGYGGCAFCRGGSGYFTGSPELSVASQLEAEIKRIRQKHENAGIIAYFQANTNTYAPLETLRKIYLPVAQNPDIMGISIGTRADCISEEIADFMHELSLLTDLTVELGMQSVHNETLRKMNIGCSHESFIEGYAKLKEKGIRTCLHIIDGLPGETEEMMLETARQTALLAPDAVKIQLLHVLKDTALEKMYLKNAFETMTMDKYISTVVSQLELLPPETVVERITGDGDKKYLVSPMWSTNKIAVLGGIDKEFARRDSFQGNFFGNLQKST